MNSILKTICALNISGTNGTAEYLVEHGANVNAEDADKDTPLFVAVLFSKYKLYIEFQIKINCLSD